MLSADLRSLAGWARGETELDQDARRALALRLDAAADRAAAMEATVVPFAARGQAQAGGAVVLLDEARRGLRR